MAASRRGGETSLSPSQLGGASKEKRKQIGKMVWFRPANTVLRVPYTPCSALAGRVRTEVDEEAKGLKLQLKVVEGGGVPLKRQGSTGQVPPTSYRERPGSLHHHRG